MKYMENITLFLIYYVYYNKYSLYITYNAQNYVLMYNNTII